jgi:RNA polymerase sigma-70 factor (ECF subfamily)
VPRIVPSPKVDAPQAVAAEGDSPAEQVAKRQAARLLDELLARLDQDKRAVLVLVDVEQCSVPQAAEALEINLNTAYWRLRQGRIEFQRALTRLNGKSGVRSGGRPQ